MTHSDILGLLQHESRVLQGAELTETHISWVILTEKFVYKIKKPVQFSFLDFSTLSKRKFYCEQELQLNRRLTEGIYLDVVPIFLAADGTPRLHEQKGDPIEYAVKMKRMDSDRQMNILLEKELVNQQHMEQLAEQLTAFHMSTEVITQAPNLKKMQDDFADLIKIEPFLLEQWGDAAVNDLKKGIAFSEEYLKINEERIYARHLEGFTVDGHGDLHTKNIFLLEEPVIFDCIEFNDHFRHLDVLNELAFLCMDLDYYGKTGLSDYLYDAYNQRYRCVRDNQDEDLFQYYKLYRANVRLKTSALTAMQIEEDVEKRKAQMQVVKRYFDLFSGYLDE
ncbi:MAG: hypothetical protein R2824_29050 [Saprospiraceae bacterium]